MASRSAEKGVGGNLVLNSSGGNLAVLSGFGVRSVSAGDSSTETSDLDDGGTLEDSGGPSRIKNGPVCLGYIQLANLSSHWSSIFPQRIKVCTPLKSHIKSLIRTSLVWI